MRDWFLRFWSDGATFERIFRSVLVGATLYARSKKWIDAEFSALIIGGGLLIPVNGVPKSNPNPNP